ncbi:hypothetical protein GGR95_000621 [Sulfitobacter undariae]|uniref:Repeat domain-containing protein n=1 Tax=Sulfitobacter undariae TaxID=1563671 RepID=A0A7W6GZH1_9RHOB|nr:VCBS repeat-containing protein [Sulfitobacter undariae]MBB3993002.1 hypothetical protein [Sulfitobacter undariae]
MTQARRRLVCPWRGTARRAVLPLCVWLAGAGTALAAETITSARFTEPTSRYAHGVLGDAEEWEALEIKTNNASNDTLSSNAVLRKNTYTIRLPLTSVFEDVAPRLADVDGDGNPEVVVVETSVTQGASLAIYDAKGKRAATPYIGTRNRWLAPVAVADLDGDGFVELAYIDRPHLMKTLRVWRFENGALSEIATFGGVTNHRVGETDIAGGLRDCGTGPEMIVANANWTRLMAVTLQNASLVARDIGPHKNRNSFNRALECR